MRAVVATRGMLLLVLGLAMLSLAGCVGSDRNFTPSAAAPPSGQTNAPVRVSTGPRVGNQAPDFVLKDVDGATVRLSDFRGKPVMVNFWASWCPPCKEEMPDIEKSYQRHKGEGYVFLGVDMKEDVKTVKDFVTRYGYTWTFLLDPDSQAINTYFVSGVPETFFIDRDGVIRDYKIGAMSASMIESSLAKIK